MLFDTLKFAAEINKGTIVVKATQEGEKFAVVNFDSPLSDNATISESKGFEGTLSFVASDGEETCRVDISETDEDDVIGVAMYIDNILTIYIEVDADGQLYL